MNVMGNSETENINQPIDQTENIPVEQNTETESTITEQDPPNKKLWEKLNTTKNKDGITYYAHSYEDFNKKYSSKESVDSMFKLLKNDKVINDDENSFYNQYYPELKKKDGQPLKNGGQDGTSPTQSPSQSQSLEVKETIEAKTPELPKYNPEEKETHNDALNLISRRKKLEKDIDDLNKGTLKLDKEQSDALMKKYASVQKKLADQKLDSPKQAIVEKELEGIDNKIDDKFRAMLSDLRETNPSTYYSFIGQNKAYNLLDDESAYKLEKLWETSGMMIGKSKDQGLVEPTSAEDYMPNFKKGLLNLDNYLKQSEQIINESSLDDEKKKEAKDAINAAASNYVYSFATPDVAKDILSEKMSGTLEYKEPKLVPNPAADPDAEIKTFGSVKYDPNAPKFIEQKDSDFNNDKDLDNYSLTSIQSKLDPNSTVDKMLFDAYSQKKGIEDAFTNAKKNPIYGDVIASAAVNYALSLDPKLQEYYKALGNDLPQDVVAQLTDEFINNPTTKDIALKQGFANDLTKSKEDFYKNFPNYSKNKVATIISQYREDTGENNGIINLPSQESVDNSVEKLVEAGKLDEQQAQIYKNEIRGDLDFLHYLGRTLTAPIGGGVYNPNPIQTQELVGGGVKSYGELLYGGYKSINKLFSLTPVGQALSSYTDLGDKLLSDKSRLARMMANNTVGQITPVGANGTWNSIGSFTGMALALALGGAEFRALGFTAETAGELAAVQGFLGDEYDKALLNHPGNTIKDHIVRTSSAATHLAIMTIGTKLLPINKATEGLAKITNSNIDKVIEKFAVGSLSSQQAQKSIVELTANFIKQAGKNSITSGTTLTAINAMNSIVGKLFGENTQDMSAIVNDAVDNWLPTVISTVAVSGFAALGSNESKLTAKNVWDIANNSDYYLSRLDKMAEKNPKIKKSLDDIKSNIKLVSETNENLKDKNFDNLTKEQKQKYLYLSLQESALLKKATSLASDPVLAKQFADKSKEFGKLKEAIINNEDKATELGKPKEDVTQEAPEIKEGENISDVEAVVKNFEKIISDSESKLKENPEDTETINAVADAKIKLEQLKKDPVKYFEDEKQKTLDSLNKSLESGTSKEDLNIEGVTQGFDNLINQAKIYGEKNARGVSGVVGTGQTSIQEQSEQGTGTEETTTGGVLQTPGVSGEGEGVGEKVSPEEADIEKRRQEELKQASVDNRIKPGIGNQVKVGGKFNQGYNLIVENAIPNESYDPKIHGDGYTVYSKIISDAEYDSNGKLSKAAKVETEIFPDKETADRVLQERYERLSEKEKQGTAKTREINKRYDAELKALKEKQQAELPKQEGVGEKVVVPSVENFTKQIEPTSSTIKTIAGDKAYNYINKDGVEVTLREDEEGGYVNGNQVQADVHLDFIGNDTKRGKGLSSKELDRIIKEADKNNMSISLIVDSEQAIRGTKSEKGLNNKELKKWYESKGFIFDKDSRFGYRPKATEDASRYKKPEYIANKGEITNDNVEYHSSPEDLQEAFDQDRLKEGTFHEDGDGYIYKLENGKLKEVKNVKYVPYENNKFVDKIEYLELPKQEQQVKFNKKTHIPDSTESIVDEMNMMGGININLTLNDILNKKGKLNIKLFKRKGIVKKPNVISISDFNGIPVMVTISDELTTGEIINPITGETIGDLKGGIGFNYSKGNTEYAWAYTNEKTAKDVLAVAKKMYEQNPQLYPDGIVPVAVVKMGKSAMVSNEAIIRQVIQNLTDVKIPEKNKIKAFNVIKSDIQNQLNVVDARINKAKEDGQEPTASDAATSRGYKEILKLIDESKSFDNLLKNVNKLNIGTRPLLINRFTSGNADIVPADNRMSIDKPATIALMEGLPKSEYKRINLGHLVKNLTDPSLSSVPDKHIISFVGIDAKADAPVKTKSHPNYPYALKGKGLGVLEETVHIGSVMPAAYGNIVNKLIKAEESSKSVTNEQMISSGLPAALNNEIFRNKPLSERVLDYNKLVGYLQLAFPNSHFFTDPKTWEEVLSSEGVKKYVKEGEIVYGLTKDGHIYLNPNYDSLNTLVHEVGHLHIDLLENTNPLLFNKGISLVEGTDALKNAIKEYGEDGIAARKEALAILIGNKGESITDAAMKSKFKEWLVAVYKYIQSKFPSLKSLTPEQIANLTLDEFINGSLKDILGGKEVEGKKTKEKETKFSKEGEKPKAEAELPKQKEVKFSKESKPVEEKEEEKLGISKEALKQKYGFVQTFDVKSDQDVADNAMNNLAVSAEKNNMSLDEQAENNMLGMIDKTGEASEQDIMTAAYYLNSLDKKIATANENGENANVLLAKRQAALEILRKLGNNAGRNLRLFANAYRNVEGNKLEVVRAELKKNLGVSDIPSSMADLNKSKLSDHDKELIEPYVKAIEKLNEDLNDIKTKLGKEKKSIDQAELEEYIKNELEKRLKSQNAPTSPTKPTTKKDKILQSKGKEWADKIRTLKIQKGQTPLDVTFGLRNLAIEAVAQIVEKGATIAEAIKEVLLDKKFSGLTEESLTNYIIKSIDIAENKETAMNKIKETATNSNSQTITQEMVDKNYIKKVVDAFINSDIPYDKIIEEATNELKTILPDVTKEEVTDALLKRNEFKPKTKKQLDNEARQKMDDIKRLEKSKNELEALEAGVDVSGIKNNNKLSTEEKKKQIEKRKSDFEKEVDAKIKKIQDDKKEADKKAAQLKAEKDKADAEAKRIKDRVASLTKQLNDIKSGVVKTRTPREKEAPEIEDVKQQIKDAIKEKAEKEKIDELTKKLNDLQAGIRPTPSTKAPSQDSPEVARLKQQIKEADKQLREIENARNKNIREQKNVNDKLKSLNEQIEYVKNNKKVFESAINNPKKANEQIKAAQEKLKDAYNKAGIRLESGNKNEIKIAKDAENAINEIKNDNNLSDEVKKEHIKDIEEQRDKDLQGTKQSVLTSLKDKVDAKIEEIKDDINDAIDNEENEEASALNEIKSDLSKLSSNLSPSKENLKDQIDKVDQDLTALINQYKGTPHENDLISIQKEFRENWQKTSDEIQRQMVIDKENRRRKEIERKINAGQYTEIPVTPFDSKRDAATVAAEAETKKAWSKLNSLSIKAKEQQEIKSGISKWLKFRRDWMVMTPGAIGKVAGSAITKPIIDPGMKQIFGRIAGSITGIKPINFTDIGKTFAQIKSEEAADKYLKDANENYVKSFVDHKQAVEKFGEDSKEAKDAKNKLDEAELTKNSAIAYLFISANSSIDIGQIIMKGATDFDASMGKYKQSSPSERTKMQNAWFWIESINRTHSAMKSISHRQALMEDFMENLQYIQSKDGTITEQGRQEAWDLAVLRSEAGRFGEDTWASRAIGKLKGSEKEWARNVGNWVFPVAKVGINITKQGLDMAFPGAELAYKAYHENIIKEFDKLPLQQKKYINTLITRGLFGLAQYAIVGYLLANGGMKYGGAYNPEDRQKVLGSDGKVLEHGQWEIGGIRMPEAFNMVFNHSPYCLPASVATMGYQQAKKGEYYKAVTGIVNEVYERLPFQATADIIAGLTGKKYKLEQIVASEVPTMKATAEFFDKDEEGNTREVKTNADNFFVEVLKKVQSRTPFARNFMEEKPILFKDSEIESNKELTKMTAAGIQLPDIGTKTFSVAIDKNHPEGEMTAEEKNKFLQKVKANYIKEINSILNEKWEGTDQKTGQVVIALGSELGKYKGDIQRATTAIQEMSNQALTKSWTNAYKEMGLEKGATTEYKWEKIGDVLFDDKSIKENPTLKQLKDSGILFNKIEAKSDIKVDKGEMTNSEYETYKKEYRERALLEIDEVLNIPQLKTEYLPEAKKNFPTGEVVSGLEELNKIKVIKNNKEISLLQDKINEALKGLNRKILIDMGLVTPEKSWKKATDIPDLDRTIEQ